MERAVNLAPRQFIASELDSLLVKKYLGFCLATVILYPRRIQQQTSLYLANV
jgi:hypothetical protein